LLLVTVRLIRKHKLREEYALVWLGASLSIVVLSIFGGLVNLLAASFAVSYAPTLILVTGLLFALAVMLSQSVILSTQARCIRDLAQNIALLEWRLRRHENEPNDLGPRADSSSGPPAPARGPRPIIES
jgi:hypothetical protein